MPEQDKSEVIKSPQIKKIRWARVDGNRPRPESHQEVISQIELADAAERFVQLLGSDAPDYNKANIVEAVSRESVERGLITPVDAARTFALALDAFGRMSPEDRDDLIETLRGEVINPDDEREKGDNKVLTQGQFDALLQFLDTP
jgi:hypothetical protein